MHTFSIEFAEVFEDISSIFFFTIIFATFNAHRMLVARYWIYDVFHEDYLQLFLRSPTRDVVQK